MADELQETPADGPPTAARRARPKRAAALRYQHDEDPMPRVVAKGQGKLADRMVEIAKEKGITVHEDPDLIELLCKLEVDQFIPPNLFLAVAEVMAYVYRVNNRVEDIRRVKRP